MRRSFVFFAIIVFFIGVSTAVAERKEPYNPTVEELKFLPPYCAVKYNAKGNYDHPVVEKWRKIIGRDFIHMHHY